MTLAAHQYGIMPGHEKIEHQPGSAGQLSPVYTTPKKKTLKEGFTLKTNQMFSVFTTLEKFENTTTILHFGAVLKTKNL